MGVILRDTKQYQHSVADSPDHIAIDGNARFANPLHTSTHDSEPPNPLPYSALPWGK